METPQDAVGALLAGRPRWTDVLRDQGRSISWLAERSGVSRSSIHLYKSGAVRPPLEWLVVVSDLLGVEVTW